MTLMGRLQKYQLYNQEIYQQQMIEQPKFTYSPLGKTFEKQIKTIKNQGEKQIKSIQDNKKQLAHINKNYKNELLHSKERETFKIFITKRLDKLEELSKKVDFDNLKYNVISSGEEFAFDKLEDPMIFLNNIKRGKISLKEPKNLQKDYEEYLNKIRKSEYGYQHNF